MSRGLSLGFSLLVLCSWTAASCVFDPLGSMPEGTTTGQGGSTSSGGPGATGVTGSASSSSGGPGGAGLCGDGIIEAPETCETGNVAFASCTTDCMIKNQCGNGVIDPGEACDQTSAECNSCSVTSGKCFGAETLPFSLNSIPSSSTSGIMIPGSFDDTGMCAMGPARSVKLYRYEVGPYPSGLFISATGDGGPVNDAVVWAYSGCSTTSSRCNDVDPDPVIGTVPNAAMLNLDLQPPGSVIFVAVGAKNMASGAFHFIAAPIRLFADFENAGDNFNAVSGWAFAPHSIIASLPASDAILESPDVDIVGLTELQISIFGSLSFGAQARVAVALDGGAPLPSIPVPDTGGFQVERQVTQMVPPGTKSAKVRLVLSPTSAPTWDVHRLLIGPKTN